MHRWSTLFIPTLREAPADAEVASHKFLVRAGYIRQLAAGIYSYLFFGQRSLNKIMGIVREEMDKIGQEFFLPALNPREVWEASGRWSLMGDNMFRLKDRKGADLCLGMTHEEVMTEIARKELRSYKQLPQIWYQIQTKFRDEPRPKAGLLRVRQFTMKDAYSFDIDADGLDVSYKKHYETYCKIFDRCGLKYVVVEAHSGAMGGSQSHEFMVKTSAGEDLVATCNKCNYAANLEKATSKLDHVDDLAAEGDGRPLEVHTPGQKTIEEVARFLGVSPKNKIKTLALMAEQTVKGEVKPKLRPIIVFVRALPTSPAALITRSQAGSTPKARCSSSTKLSKAAKTSSRAPTKRTTTSRTSSPAATSNPRPTPTYATSKLATPAPTAMESSASTTPSKSATSSSSATNTRIPWAPAYSTRTAKKSLRSWEATASVSNASSPLPSSKATTRMASGCRPRSPRSKS